MALILSAPATHYSRKPSIRQSLRKPHPSATVVSPPMISWDDLLPTVNDPPHNALGRFLIWLTAFLVAVVIIVAPHALAVAVKKTFADAQTRRNTQNKHRRVLHGHHHHAAPVAPLSKPLAHTIIDDDDDDDDDEDLLLLADGRDRIVPSGRPGARVRFLIHRRPMPVPLLCHSIFDADDGKEESIHIEQVLQ